MKRFLMFSFILLIQNIAFAGEQKVLKTAVFGLGGRGLTLIEECLKLKDQTQTSLEIVAICDDNAHLSLPDYSRKQALEFKKTYESLFKHTHIYPDTPEGLKNLFENHPDLDRILITSPNYRHLDHLAASLQNSSCKHIFIEKPLLRSLDEFAKIDDFLDEREITIGLTLRYSNMTRIVTQKLKDYQERLGAVKKVSSWEEVDFGHAFSIIMMNWRRSQRLSGGMMLDKSVHDLDLAFYILETMGVKPKSLRVTTTASHDVFKKSNQPKFLKQLLESEQYANRFKCCANWTWQRIIPYVQNASGAYDWEGTLNEFFKDFPDDDDFSKSDLIFDNHKLKATITDENGSEVDFELTTKLKDTLGHRRGSYFVFENGAVMIDVMQSKMRVVLNHCEPVEFDLEADGSMHAGGDLYVAHTILDTLPQDHHKAMFHNPALQLSTVMALVSEYQASNRIDAPIQITKIHDKWEVDLPINP